MGYYVGLDVSMQSTAICVMNEKGVIFEEAMVESTPESIIKFLKCQKIDLEIIGLESGALTHYLQTGLQDAGYRVACMESRKMAAILAVLINKTDKNDARGIAEALRAGHFQECVHRSDDAVEIRSLLHMRQTAIEQKTAVSNSLRGHLKMYGIRINQKAGKSFRQTVEEATKALRESVRRMIAGLLNILDTVNKELDEMTRLIKKVAAQDEDVKLLQTVDGVGPITALAFKAEVDDPKRFADSKDVGAYIGLTPSQYSSGEVKHYGRISKKGSKRTRYLLVEAASALLTRCKHWSKLKAWGFKLMKKKGNRKAVVALARKLAVTMHRMLLTKEPFNRALEKQAITA